MTASRHRLHSNLLATRGRESDVDLRPVLDEAAEVKSDAAYAALLDTFGDHGVNAAFNRS